MRSIAVFVRATGPEAILQLFSRRRFQRVPNGWTVFHDGKAALYLYDPKPGSDYADEYAFPPGCSPTDYLHILADVSGRIAGDQEVREFLELVLTTFEGFAFDEYTDHAWTLDEIRQNHQEQGHPLFDYRGWYEERKSAGKQD